MSNTRATEHRPLQILWLASIRNGRRGQTQHDALTDELQAAFAREEALLREKGALLQRQDMLAQEFDHRLFNSLQLITSLLSMQSRGASAEAAAHLDAAAHRIAAFGRVHRRLHVLDHQEKVEFKQYLQQLCEDLSGLLRERTGHVICVEGTELEIPTLFATPLGFIVAELVTNSAKYAKSNVVVRLETSPALGHSLSVVDNGPGFPTGFDPTKSKGLGMKIILSLVQQIKGTLRIAPGDNGCGACFTVTFCGPRFGT